MTLTNMIYCLADGRHHKFSTFMALAREITSHYKKLLKSAEELITKMCELSKETWRKLDDKEKKCNEWIDQIKNIRDEQVCWLICETCF